MVNNISILKNITILYAEDEKDLREVTHQILKGFTKKQYVAQNGQEGLELFKKYEIGNIHIQDDKNCKSGTIGLEFDCDWDIENGLGVKIENWEIKEVGVAESSYY